MPKLIFAVMLLGVIMAAGITVWLASAAGPAAIAIAVPLFLIASLLVRKRYW